MSLVSNHNCVKIFNDLYEELNHFTHGRYTSSIAKFLNASYDTEPRVLIKVILTLRKIRLGTIKNKKKVSLYYKYIIKLLNSQNILNNGDAQPIGQLLSLTSCANKAQNVLNVKRLKRTNNEEIVNTASPLYQYIKNDLCMNNRKIKPIVRDTSLYENKTCFWIRIWLNGNDAVSSLKNLLSNEQIKINLYDIGTVSEVYNIVELYYWRKGKTQMLNIIEVLNNLDIVNKIIFCSDLVRMSKQKFIPKAVIYSNMMKFYYAYKTCNLTFVLTKQEDLEIFNYTSILCGILMYGPNFTSTNHTLKSCPLAALSNARPLDSIKINARIVEPVTPYEQLIFKEYPEKKTSTAATDSTFENGGRHQVYTISQDRAYRMTGNCPNIGGVNTSEISIVSTPEHNNHVIGVLKSMY